MNVIFFLKGFSAGVVVMAEQRQADLCVPGQLGLQSKFQDSQGYLHSEILSQKQKQTKKSHTNVYARACGRMCVHTPPPTMSPFLLG